MEVMMRLEEQFGIAVDTDIIAELISVPKICDYIAEHKSF
jgi:acyl carrier protein